MHVRTVYFKVDDMDTAVAFWGALLGVKAHKTSPSWHEFMSGTLRIGLLLNDFEETASGANCVPVFECADDELEIYIRRAKKLGAKVIVDGLLDPKLLSVVFADPFGNEFEISKFHD